jgi:hypothetical protein
VAEKIIESQPDNRVTQDVQRGRIELARKALEELKRSGGKGGGTICPGVIAGVGEFVAPKSSAVRKKLDAGEPVTPEEVELAALEDLFNYFSPLSTDDVREAKEKCKEEVRPWYDLFGRRGKYSIPSGDPNSP